ncbi:MAG: CsbD family protein [Leptothrix sp. (in: Bacteria)]|nr:CsbD family protein [Leptothrix sp. (in: b-proteobacteria)]
MNKDQVSGRAEEVKGKIKEAAGSATDNERLKAEGKADQLTGKVKAGYGDAKEKVKDAIDKA